MDIGPMALWECCTDIFFPTARDKKWSLDDSDGLLEQPSAATLAF